MMPLPEFPGCFVCGKDNQRGLRLTFHAEGDGIHAAFTPDQTLAGYDDTVHGGIISALLDEAIVWAAYVATGTFGVTAELNIRYRQFLPVNMPCLIFGKMVENRRKVWIVKSEIVHRDGTIYATATGKVLPRKES